MWALRTLLASGPCRPSYRILLYMNLVPEGFDRLADQFEVVGVVSDGRDDEQVDTALVEHLGLLRDDVQAVSSAHRGGGPDIAGISSDLLALGSQYIFGPIECVEVAMTHSLRQASATGPLAKMRRGEVPMIGETSYQGQGPSLAKAAHGERRPR